MSYVEKESLLEKKEFYNKYKDVLSIEIKEKLDQAFDIDFTYNSTTIEGNTLSLIETKALIEDKVSIGGKKLREIYEVINHNKAFKYVKKYIEKRERLDEDKIKDIHEILTENIMQGGIYRNTDVVITGASHIPPTPNDMYNQLRFFFQDLNENSKKMNVMEFAAWTHAEFVKIHPFIDGNGRTARLIMNYQLMFGGYLPISIKFEDKLNYYSALDLYATTGDLQAFITLIEELEEKRLDDMNKIIQQEIDKNS